MGYYTAMWVANAWLACLGAFLELASRAPDESELEKRRDNVVPFRRPLSYRKVS